MEGSNVEKVVQDHEKRLLRLEHQTELFTRQMAGLETQQLRTESTLIAENRETKDLLKTLIAHGQKMEEEEFRARQESSKWRHESSDNRNKRLFDISIKLLGSGGLIYVVVMAYLNSR